MTDEGSASAPPRREDLLEAIARAEGNPVLFPPEVLRLHREGRARKARQALLRSAKEERDEALAAARREKAANLHLWQDPLRRAPTMFRLNGVGTRLHGAYQRANDGTYVSTLWFTFLWIPLWPIAAYVVLPGETAGWHFLARVPLPPKGDLMRRVSGSIGALGVAAIAALTLWSGSHVDVHAYNGFDRPVVVTVGDDSRQVPARQHVVFSDVSAADMRLSAAWDAASEPFESVDVDLAGHARDVVTYNVAGRAVLQVDYVTYGDRPPREGRMLDAGPVLFESGIDHAFEEPPESLSVSEGGSTERSMLYAGDDFVPVVNVVTVLVDRGRVSQASTVARAELLLHPENAELAYLTALSTMPDDREGQLELMRWCIARAPDVVDLHRYYQELWGDDRRAELRAEYADLLSRNPESPMYHYLVGRAEESGSAEALAHYGAALERDPEYGPAIRALGYTAWEEGHWSEALTQYDHYARLGSAEAVEVVTERSRVRRRLGRPLREVEEILSAQLEAAPQDVGTSRLLSHVRVAGDPTRVEEASRDLMATLSGVYPDTDVRDLAHILVADLMITAGDLTGARTELTQVVDPSARDLRVVERLALSDGAAAEDRALLTDTPDWTAMLPTPGTALLALELVDEPERDELVARLPDTMIPIAEHIQGPDVARAQRLGELIHDLSPDMYPWVYYAASRRAGALGDAAAARRYLDEARASALPGELPYLRN